MWAECGRGEVVERQSNQAGIESGLARAAYDISALRANRTKLGLKDTGVPSLAPQPWSANRTKLGLKERRTAKRSAAGRRANRTKLGLKERR